MLSRHRECIDRARLPLYLSLYENLAHDDARGIPPSRLDLTTGLAMLMHHLNQHGQAIATNAGRSLSTCAEQRPGPSDRLASTCPITGGRALYQCPSRSTCTLLRSLPDSAGTPAALRLMLVVVHGRGPALQSRIHFKDHSRSRLRRSRRATPGRLHLSPMRLQGMRTDGVVLVLVLPAYHPSSSRVRIKFSTAPSSAIKPLPSGRRLSSG